MSYGTANSNSNISSRMTLQRQETSPLLAQTIPTTPFTTNINTVSHFSNNKQHPHVEEKNNYEDGEDEVNDWNDPDAEIDACEVQRALQAKLLHKSIIVPRQFAQQGSFSLAPTAPVTRIHTPVASFNEQDYHHTMHNNNNNNNTTNNEYVAPYTYTDLLAIHGNHHPSSHNLLRPLKDQEKLTSESPLVPTEQIHSILHSNDPSQLEESKDSIHNSKSHMEQTTFGSNNRINDLLNDEPHAFVASPITRNETELFPSIQKASTLPLDKTHENAFNCSTNSNDALRDGIAVTVPLAHNTHDTFHQTTNNNNNNLQTCCRAMNQAGSTNSLCSTLSRFTAAGAEVQCNPTLSINLVRHTEIPMSTLAKVRNSGLQINTSLVTSPQQAHWATSSAASSSSSLGVTPFINTLKHNNTINNHSIITNIENIGSSHSFPVFQTMPNNDVMLLASSSLAANVMPVQNNNTQEQLLLSQRQQSRCHLDICTNITNESKMHLEHDLAKSDKLAGPNNLNHVMCNTVPEDSTVFNITPNQSSLDESPYNQTPMSSTDNTTMNNSTEYQPNAPSVLDEEHENNFGGDVCFVFEPRTEPIDVFISYLYPVHYNALIVVESSEAATALAANESKLPELLNDVGVANNTNSSNKTPLVAKSPMVGKSPLLQNGNSTINNESNKSIFASQSKTTVTCTSERKEINDVNGAVGDAASPALTGKRMSMDNEHISTPNFITPCSTDSGLTTSSMSTLQPQPQPPPPPPPPPLQPNQVIGASFLRLKNKSFASLPNSLPQYERKEKEKIESKNVVTKE